MIGDVLSNRYDIIDIKRGGMGEVLICKDMQNEGKKIALKSYRKDFLDEKIADLFIKEAQAWIKIGEGEFILSPDRIEKIQGRPFIIMSYCENGSLRDLINKGPIPKERACEIIAQIALGMYRIGDRENLVHQDLKPENILFDGENRVLISDLGIVRAIANTSSNNKESGISGTTVGGTLPYTAPEQLLDVKQLDQRIDIYAVGLLFYEMLTGEYAVFGNTHEEYYHKILKGTPSRLNEISSKFGKNYAKFIEKCIHKDRSKRPASFKEVCSELDLLIKPGDLAIKLPVWKNDNRVEITDSMIISGWTHIFRERLPEHFFASFKYTDMRLCEQAKDLRQLEKYELAINKCKEILGDHKDEKSSIGSVLVKIDKSSPGDKFHYFDIKSEDLRTTIFADVGMVLDVIELLMMCYVDLIESPDVTENHINEFDEFADYILSHKNIPSHIVFMCAQAKVTSKSYDTAIQILSYLSEVSEGVFLHRVLSTLAIALNAAKKKDDLIELVINKTIPILGKHDSNIAQKYCGQAIAMLNKFDLALPYFLKAYDLDSNDLWSLNQAGVCLINMGKIDSAKEVYFILNDSSPNHPLTKRLAEVITKAEEYYAQQKNG